MMNRSMIDGLPGKAVGLLPVAYALLLFAAWGAQPLIAQPFRSYTATPTLPSPEARQSFQTKLHEEIRLLANAPLLGRVPNTRRQALLEFIVGNTLFVAAREMGHALVTEMKLPALGGEEQAADDFGVLTMLKHGEKDFSDRILIEGAKGWFVSSRRGNKRGRALDYYARRGFTERRGYRIVCLMIGADPVRFKALADETMLPKLWQRRCGWDYDTVGRSWERVLTPYRRAADQPKARIEVVYGEATDKLAVYAGIFRNLGFLEAIAELAADRFAWPEPIIMEMRSCGDPGAGWIASTRKLHICYEMARHFAELYRDFGQDRTWTKHAGER
jgi:hypothetical protein